MSNGDYEFSTWRQARYYTDLAKYFGTEVKYAEFLLPYDRKNAISTKEIVKGSSPGNVYTYNDRLIERASELRVPWPYIKNWYLRFVNSGAKPKKFKICSLEWLHQKYGRESVWVAINVFHHGRILSFYSANDATKLIIPEKSDNLIQIYMDGYYSQLVKPAPEEHKRYQIRLSLTKLMKDAIHAKYDYTCVYCGSQSEHIDHVIPVSRGGTNDEGNLVAACASCNLTKSDRLLSELGWTIGGYDG